MEVLELIELLADRDELDRLAGDGLHRERRSAACVAVELRHQHAVECDAFLEGERDVYRLLAGHRVDDEEHVRGLRFVANALELGHQLHVSARTPSRTTATGSDSAASARYTGTWICLPSCSSWSIAAGRWRSAATSPGLWPSLRRSSASLAAAVVFPEPCRPASRITVGGRPVNASPDAPAPINAVSSSWTIFTTCWPGFRLLRTSCPTARSRTWATKSLTTSKLT